ncbi:acetolactate synthase large subunit [Intrasporangium calvum]|uniref:Thiamine pyrophosphate TPP-binding domain-containing protein n=1 Tax=Intrasporangium calvum (strain ATCC 23552 / DSM 43043 / JCM 3097 / NBRC 12989 / NCIMB 10167 / NRRL B-3866 / 7 KIP) TaxID=710696 RepID=E6SCH5_INTC7|nr:acetolactate synthase large subunit [Intrasporangium calvum]ADU48554.1 thiamine pyrophosphate TPP-binding domain-containing protein [Intrasporangium calvum DSM 43043]
MPTGAQALLRTLVDAGVTVCFTNPGTSEMHFVAALDSVPEMRAVLALFEGVATGAADGYARMTGRPAATLLHLGPGLGNGLANLHNARRARVPVVNIVGDHATYHVQYDAQLQSDIETVARNVSPGWVRTSTSAEALPTDLAEAVAAASGPPGQVATLIVPADLSWAEGVQPAVPVAPATPPLADGAAIEAARSALLGKKSALLLGGSALHGPALRAAGRIAAATGATLFAEVFPRRIERGAGVPPVERIAYFAELASVQLAGLKHLVLVDAPAPVSFFAYPGKKSYLVPEGCMIHRLTTDGQDVAGTLEALAEVVVTRETARAAPKSKQPVSIPTLPKGRLTAETACRTVAALLPEGAIVSDEANTSGVSFAGASAGAPPHDVLTLTGGAIGQGLPVAVGAAIACPDRPVVALEADGSALYTIQSLWTMARERLDVTVVIFNNRSYGILDVELQRVGAQASGQKAQAQLDLADPPVDFVAVSRGLGVPAVLATTTQELATALRNAFAEPGPHLVEVAVPPVFSGRRLKALPMVLGSLESLPGPLAKALKRRIAP